MFSVYRISRPLNVFLTLTRPLTLTSKCPLSKETESEVVQMLEKCNPHGNRVKLDPIQIGALDVLTVNEKLPKHWKIAIESNPSLLSRGGNLLRTIDLTLADLNPKSTPEMRSRLMSSWPNELWSVNTKTLTDKLQQWTIFCKDIRQLNWMRILAEVPQVLFLNPEEWMLRKSQLDKYFKSPELGILITNAPNVLLEEEETLEKMIGFYIREMHVSAKDIANTGALAADIDEVRARFTFLERTGCYKHPPARSVGLHSKASPDLSLILIRDKLDFLTKTTGGMVSVEEFNSFCMLYHLENGDERFFEEEDDYHDEEMEEIREEQQKFKEQWTGIPNKSKK